MGKNSVNDAKNSGNDAKQLNIDANRLGLVKLDGIRFKKIRTHFNECESCESTQYQAWVVQMGVKSIGMIAWCPKCREHTIWGGKCFESPASELITSFQIWLEQNT